MYPSIKSKLKEAEKASEARYCANVAGLGVHYELLEELTKILVEQGLITDGVKLDYTNWSIHITFKYHPEDDTWKKIYRVLRQQGWMVKDSTPENLEYEFRRQREDWDGVAGWNRWDTEQGSIRLAAEFPDTCTMEKIGEKMVATPIYKRTCAEFEVKPEDQQAPEEDFKYPADEAVVVNNPNEGDIPF